MPGLQEVTIAFMRQRGVVDESHETVSRNMRNILDYFVGKALSMLDRGESAIAVVESIGRIREQHMLKEIRQHDADAVVMGNSHAKALSRDLREYTYIDLS